MIVSNTSPLICLAKSGRLNLLKDLFGEVLIEEEVQKEAVGHGKKEGAPDALVIESAIKEGWIKVEKLKKKREFKGIHEGESYTILLAKKHNCIALIDEEDARAVARALGIEVRGTLYVLRKAAEENILTRDEAIGVLDDMVANGLRISARIYSRFLNSVK
ncbi:MAG: DUF3368 domain-containing protein [Candidatus Altiarchaeales archaeon]|nr:DUF3368 domain-containing protein [Candidatus Altiarchaeota archaeon]MCG2782104.1 DUF3368 domain-containing protein [Candidatus Altiarchaeales archaeon]MBU4267213.1 DUF3368 domain-containing protein [Candidatus Altiarchaeota archaeon]MBU4341751.1 DUF3368 domain-containing protein [Candidatus Altiarchaeota archaeon]MBU4406030.1 DUF3368 domain-containing protein [Candidatus Altiarchaeota archaeon]